MKILKFGGTSVLNGGRIRNMVDILVGLRNAGIRFHVVCSAMKGITDTLILAAKTAEAGDESYSTAIDEIWKRQTDAVSELFGADERDGTGSAGTAETVLEGLASMVEELREIVSGVFLVKECSLRSMDLIMSFGERLNNFLIAAYMNRVGLPARYIDTRSLIRTDSSHGRAEVDFSVTNRRINEYFASGVPKGVVGVLTGFIASSEKGITTTLGRNGSDYTASILASALGATDIEIWTDVDGVLEADPRVVPGARVIDDLSIDEAMEMSYFGAEVLHPYTMLPAIESGIPIWIKNTLNPRARGTRISKSPTSGRGGTVVTGIASIPRVAMINILGGGMVGSRGLAAKIFGAIGKSEANIIMISQASSEHSICIVVRQSEAENAVSVLNKELAHEVNIKLVQDIQVARDLEIVSIIGAGMRGTPGVSGKLFSGLGNAGVNVLAIAQGSSEMNISCVIHSDDHAAALNAIHSSFFG